MDRSANNAVNVNRFLDLRIANGRFIVKQKLGSGSFGEIFSGIDTAKGNKDVAIKLEQVKTRHPQLAYESKIYKLLHANNGVSVPAGGAAAAAGQQQNRGGGISSPSNQSPAPQHIYSDGQGGGAADSNATQWASQQQQQQGGYGGAGGSYGNPNANSGDYQQQMQNGGAYNGGQQPHQFLPAVGATATNGNFSPTSGMYAQNGGASSSSVGIAQQQRRMSAGGDAMGVTNQNNPYGAGVINSTNPNYGNHNDGPGYVSGSPSQQFPPVGGSGGGNRLPPLTGASRLPPMDPTASSQQQFQNLQLHNQQLMLQQQQQQQMQSNSNALGQNSSNIFSTPQTQNPMTGRRSSVSDPANQGGQYGSASNPLSSNPNNATMMASGGGTSIGSSYANYVIGVPDIYYFGVEGDYNVMVIDLCGPSLEDLFCYSGRKFSLKTIVLLADQLLHRIQFLHSKYLIHRDLKPENFVMGMRDKSHHVYLIDYGLSKRYWDGKTNQHIPYMEGKPLTGTARYCSVNTHLGIEQSRRDDLESIGYIILYFYKGSLPWQGIRAIEPSQKTVRIGEKKISIGVEYLCRDEPPPFMRYMKYCRGLKFEETPDYQWCRRLFSELGEKEGIKRDWVFDWVEKRNRERVLEESQSINGSMADGVVGSSITGFTNNPNVNSKLSFYNNESSNNTVRANEMSHRSLI